MKANARLAGIILALAIAIAFFATEATAATTNPMSVGYDTDLPTPGIQNSHPHNLSSGSSAAIHAPAAGEGRVCVFCHTPHAASPKGPLWNRRDPIGPNGNGTFPLYGTSTGRLDEIEIDNIAAAEYGTGEYPNGASRLCLSCHDGVTAVGEVLNGGTLANLTMSGNGTIDLNGAHPISFVYIETVRVDIEAAQPGAAGQYTLPGAGFLDDQNRMQCTTCHDPHIDTNDGGAYSLPMWSNYVGVDENVDYEATCGQCHVGGSGSGGLERGGGIGGNHPI